MYTTYAHVATLSLWACLNNRWAYSNLNEYRVADVMVETLQILLLLHGTTSYYFCRTSSTTSFTNAVNSLL